MTGLLALALRLALAAAVAFGIIVVLEHGTQNFPSSAAREAAALAEFFQSMGKTPPPPPPSLPTPPEDTPDPFPGASEAALAAPPDQPEPSSIPAPERLQERTIGEGSAVNDPVGLPRD